MECENVSYTPNCIPAATACTRYNYVILLHYEAKLSLSSSAMVLDTQPSNSHPTSQFSGVSVSIHTCLQFPFPFLFPSLFSRHSFLWLFHGGDTTARQLEDHVRQLQDHDMQAITSCLAGCLISSCCKLGVFSACWPRQSCLNFLSGPSQYVQE